MGQFYFTAPLVIVLYFVSVELVLPWLLPYLPDGPPLYAHELAALRSPIGSQWLGVGASGAIGGFTHIFLDGFTHADRSGWATRLFPVLRSVVDIHGRPFFVYDILQIVLTVALGVWALRMWAFIGRRHLVFQWNERGARSVALRKPIHRRAFARWLLLCVLAGVVMALGLRPNQGVGLAMERAAYGALTFFALGLLLGASSDRVVRPPARTSPGPGAHPANPGVAV